jgi:hypothetical protein
MVSIVFTRWSRCRRSILTIGIFLLIDQERLHKMERTSICTHCIDIIRRASLINGKRAKILMTDFLEFSRYLWGLHASKHFSDSTSIDTGGRYRSNEDNGEIDRWLSSRCYEILRYARKRTVFLENASEHALVVAETCSLLLISAHFCSSMIQSGENIHKFSLSDISYTLILCVEAILSSLLSWACFRFGNPMKHFPPASGRL